MNKTTVVYSKTFAESCEAISKKLKPRILNTVNSFFNNPLSVGLHQEKLASPDNDIYSARVNDEYRIIFKRPIGNSVVFLLFVGKHDDAYTWAKKHCSRIHPFTGGIQVYEPIKETTRVQQGIVKKQTFFADVTDKQFEHLGVPMEYRSILREKVYKKQQLFTSFKSILTDETYEALEWIIEGLGVEGAIDYYDKCCEAIEVPPIEQTKRSAFSDVSDEQLVRLGIPMEYINLVRLIKTDSDITRLNGKLPEEAVQSLYALYNGEPVNSILRGTFGDSHPVEDDDYAAALQNPITKSQFAEMQSESELSALLDMPMEKWRIFLHPSQRRMVERHFNGAARVIGGAGTGKTVITIHRARFLARECINDERILVTTFSKTLAADIQMRLEMICSPDELSRIDVIHIDALTKQIVEQKRFKILYNVATRGKTEGVLDAIWNRAIMCSKRNVKYDTGFFIDEWSAVIQAQRIESLEQYLSASRVSRGKRLDKKAREDVWEVCRCYQEIMLAQRTCDTDMAQNMCAGICAEIPALRKYKSILVDECQDLGAPAYRMLRALAGAPHSDDLYLSGDDRQRIYKGKASLSQCGISVVGRSMQLKLNYRTTQEICDAAYSLQREYKYDDLDGQITDSDKSICVFHGEKPTIKGYSSYQSQINAVIEDIRKKDEQGITLDQICIIARTNSWIYSCEKKLREAGIPTLRLSRDQHDDHDLPGVRLATMHRVKGMEFTCVYIVCVNSDELPPKRMIRELDEDDAEAIHEIIKQEANLLAVAMTRAKRFAWISYVGKPSELVYRLQGA